ncbi:alpha/beta-hydrolase [Amniculicola lignicola CBS 123094]|uniref:Alpha/beta-hydrolase n=1 Tax=Amniculicola lignicola CBS 123094 TaxID=1392246 RepID=A0A6A5WAZ5_9PLEO|nr:alpha/beta-hydrolase [Amniculicola lignicola CBS 123094]
MSTYQTAKTQYLKDPDSETTTYAYRIIGPLSHTTNPSNNSTPLLFLPHFRGVMDLIDPLLINSLATTRPVLLIDYVGTGKSTGKVASTAGESASQIHRFLKLAGFAVVDVLGFSVGSRIAQLVALNAKDSGTGVAVRRLVVAGGTANPVEGNGIQRPRAERAERIPELAAGPEIPFEAFYTLFFRPDEVGRKACEQWWDRLGERSEESSGEPVSRWVDEGYKAWDEAAGIQGQATQLSAFDSVEGSQGNEGSWERLPSLDIPVLVANGSDDYMVPTINTFVTAQRIPKAKAIIYPNSGHAFLYQYAEEFAADVDRFLTAAV